LRSKGRPKHAVCRDIYEISLPTGAPAGADMSAIAERGTSPKRKRIESNKDEPHGPI
jgi:hypothetical protein